jgi:hypothetical protein
VPIRVAIVGLTVVSRVQEPPMSQQDIRVCYFVGSDLATYHFVLYKTEGCPQHLVQ